MATRIAQLIGKREGFGVPGTIPTIRHNPGDLRHSPHSSHEGIDPNAVGEIDNDVDGWSDEERQLRLYAQRGLTLRQTIFEWAPPNENNSAAYLQFVLDGLADTPLAEVLKVSAV